MQIFLVYDQISENKDTYLFDVGFRSLANFFKFDVVVALAIRVKPLK